MDDLNLEQQSYGQVSNLNHAPVSKLNMGISKKLLKYFNRKASKSSDKNHTRYRNDICNHWDLDYLSMEELEERLKDSDIETTIPRKKKEDQGLFDDKGIYRGLNTLGLFCYFLS